MEKGILKYPKNIESPFKSQTLSTIKTRGKINSISREKIQLIDKDTGEVNNHDTVFMHQKKEVDTEQFVKIFTDQIQSIFDLTKNASKTISYFMKALRINEDTVLFDMEDCKNYLGYNSSKSVYIGLGELLDKQFIARANKPNQFFINPTHFFNGNRIVLINEWILKKSEKSMKDLNQYDMITGKTNRDMKQLRIKYLKAK